MWSGGGSPPLLNCPNLLFNSWFRLSELGDWMWVWLKSCMVSVSLDPFRYGSCWIWSCVLHEARLTLVIEKTRLSLSVNTDTKCNRVVKSALEQSTEKSSKLYLGPKSLILPTDFKWCSSATWIQFWTVFFGGRTSQTQIQIVIWGIERTFCQHIDVKRTWIVIGLGNYMKG